MELCIKLVIETVCTMMHSQKSINIYIYIYIYAVTDEVTISVTDKHFIIRSEAAFNHVCCQHC